MTMRTFEKQAREFVKARRKVYRNEIDGFYEFEGQTYRTKAELYPAVLKSFACEVKP